MEQNQNLSKEAEAMHKTKAEDEFLPHKTDSVRSSIPATDISDGKKKFEGVQYVYIFGWVKK